MNKNEKLKRELIAILSGYAYIGNNDYLSVRDIVACHREMSPRRCSIKEVKHIEAQVVNTKDLLEQLVTTEIISSSDDTVDDLKSYPGQPLVQCMGYKVKAWAVPPSVSLENLDMVIWGISTLSAIPHYGLFEKDTKCAIPEYMLEWFVQAGVGELSKLPRGTGLDVNEILALVEGPDYIKVGKMYRRPSNQAMDKAIRQVHDNMEGALYGTYAINFDLPRYSFGTIALPEGNYNLAVKATALDMLTYLASYGHEGPNNIARTIERYSREVEPLKTVGCSEGSAKEIATALNDILRKAGGSVSIGESTLSLDAKEGEVVYREEVPVSYTILNSAPARAKPLTFHEMMVYFMEMGKVSGAAVDMLLHSLGSMAEYTELNKTLHDGFADHPDGYEIDDVNIVLEGRNFEYWVLKKPVAIERKDHEYQQQPMDEEDLGEVFGSNMTPEAQIEICTSAVPLPVWSIQGLMEWIVATCVEDEVYPIEDAIVLYLHKLKEPLSWDSVTTTRKTLADKLIATSKRWGFVEFDSKIINVVQTSNQGTTICVSKDIILDNGVGIEGVLGSLGGLELDDLVKVLVKTTMLISEVHL